MRKRTRDPLERMLHCRAATEKWRTAHDEIIEGSCAGRDSRKGGRWGSGASRWTIGGSPRKKYCHAGWEDRRASAEAGNRSGWDCRWQDHRPPSQAEESQGRGDRCRCCRRGGSRRGCGQTSDAVERKGSARCPDDVLPEKRAVSNPQSAGSSCGFHTTSQRWRSGSWKYPA